MMMSKHWIKGSDAYNAKTGYDIPIHVDAASGGFILPFLYPEKEMGLPFEMGTFHQRIHSQVWFGISGTRMGFVGKAKEYLPEEMSFSVNYLGANITQVGLNFSRPACTNSGTILSVHPFRIPGLQRSAVQLPANCQIYP